MAIPLILALVITMNCGSLEQLGFCFKLFSRIAHGSLGVLSCVLRNPAKLIPHEGSSDSQAGA